MANKRLTADKRSILIILLLFFPATFLPSVSPRANEQKDNWAKDYGERFLPRPDDPPAILNSGGPDAFGYFFYDSRDPAENAPVYRWINIADTLRDIRLDQDDEISGLMPIGFDFPFYGQTFTHFRACTNGWISFTSISTDYLNRRIPTPDEPNNLLAAFWDDLVVQGSRAYRYSNNTDTLIVAWHNYHHYSGPGNYTFEIVLTADGSIVFQYPSVSGTLDSHTIGIENSTGTAGLEYVYNTYRNETGTAIYFGPRPPQYATHDVMPIRFVLPPASGRVGSPFAPVVRFINAGLFTESFEGRVTINRAGEIYYQTRNIFSLPPDSAVTISFPIFTPHDPGIYELRAVSYMPTDLYPVNDTIFQTYVAYASRLIYDFEEDSASFFGDNDWQWGNPTTGPQSAHSGTKVWGTVLNDTYSPGPLLSTLYADTLLLDTSAVLTFWHWYDIEALFDGGNVKLSTDDGASWNIITPVDGYDGILSNVFHNPLGGEPAFFGRSNTWILETFDLSAYAEQDVLIKFDFGVDFSTISWGWYIDDFAVDGGREARPGWLSGVISDGVTLEPIAGAFVQAGRRNSICDSLGRYSIEMLPGTYNVMAVAEYYSPFTLENVVIVADDTNSLGLSLASPAIEVDTTAIDTSLAPGQSTVMNRQISNSGTGLLEFNVRIEQTGNIRPLDFGDEVFTFDPQTQTGDASCIGVEFDGDNFWVTGRHESDDIHKLYKFDRNGVLVASYDQNTVSQWGWRDLAWDGSYLYASDENELAVIDPSSGQKIETIPMPVEIPAPLRALACDPSTNRFWAANFTSDIIEFGRTGEVLRSFPSDRHIYGLAWDNVSPGGPYLWVFSQDGDPLTQISRFNPATGSFGDTVFYAIDHNGGISDLAGGACFTSEWDPGLGVLFCLVMGRTTLFDSFDMVQGYEITTLSRWLTVEPEEGVVQPGSSMPLTITISLPDSLTTPDSVYEAVIVLENNSRRTPSIPVRTGVYSGIEDGDKMPDKFELWQNYPNPFNSSTKIAFSLASKSDVTIEIYNIVGQKLGTLVRETFDVGRHAILWNASGLASGVYFIRFSAGQFSQTKVTTLIK